jgi:hypothetical protein
MDEFDPATDEDDLKDHLRLVAFMNRFPALVKAYASSQSTFDPVVEPTENDMPFITRVTDSPVVIEGRLAPDGIWRFSQIYIPVPGQEEELELAIGKEVDNQMLVLVDGIGETMVRFAVSKTLESLARSDEVAREFFMRRLAQTRFANPTRH